MTRMENAADPEEEGLKIALHLLTQIKRKPGVHGLHILAPYEEQVVPRLVKGLNLRTTAMGIATFFGSNNGHKKNGHQAVNPFNFSGTEHNKNLNI
jgi:hypothetical protein